MQNEVLKLEELEEKLKTIDIDYKKDFGSGSQNKRLIDLEIPKFKIESEVELSKPLQKVRNF